MQTTGMSLLEKTHPKPHLSQPYTYLLLSHREPRRQGKPQETTEQWRNWGEVKTYVQRPKRWRMESGYPLPQYPNFPEIPGDKLPLLFVMACPPHSPPPTTHTYLNVHGWEEQIQIFHPLHCCSYSLSVLELRTQSTIFSSTPCGSTTKGKAPDSKRSQEGRSWVKSEVWGWWVAQVHLPGACIL